MTLALHLNRTLAELRTTLSSAEYTLWRGYDSVYGLPSTRAEVGTAIGCAAVCQTHGAKVSARELLPRFDKPAAEPVITDPAEQNAMLRAWANNVNRSR